MFETTSGFRETTKTNPLQSNHKNTKVNITTATIITKTKKKRGLLCGIGAIVSNTNTITTTIVPKINIKRAFNI